MIYKLNLKTLHTGCFLKIWLLVFSISVLDIKQPIFLGFEKNMFYKNNQRKKKKQLCSYKKWTFFVYKIRVFLFSVIFVNFFLLHLKNNSFTVFCNNIILGNNLDVIGTSKLRTKQNFVYFSTEVLETVKTIWQFININIYLT